ncbi:Hypothetical protein GLP15_1209 [Giardia lamblia P15]|uniref:Uncharacterized protein n=1 Tax=Giardia intestinalis (strain P15) TaxID=658858 RepID=E1EZV1_GIAIA|nr:Hypothetical protein GLP15_1209 [Giardia lamblia P15]
MRGEGFAIAARGPDNRFRELLTGSGRPGFTSVTQLPAQQMQRKIDLFDWRSRRQPHSKLLTTQTKGISNINDTGNKSEHNTVIAHSLATSKTSGNNLTLGGLGAHPTTDQHNQEKLHTEIPLNTFLLSTIDHDLPGTLPFNDLDKMQLPQLSSCLHTDYLNSLTRTQDTTKYDFCNPELYDDPFGDPIPSSDAHQITRVTPAKYTDNIPRIQRSLSIKQDLTGNLPGLHDPMARSMDFNSLASRTRHRLGIGATPMSIPSSVSLVNLINNRGEAGVQHTSSKLLSKEQKGAGTTPRSTTFKNSLAQSQLSMDSDSRDSEIYPICETSNLACLKRIDSDLSSIQEKGSPQPLSHTVTALTSAEKLLSPGTPHVLHSASAKRSSKAAIVSSGAPATTAPVVASSSEVSPTNNSNCKRFPITLESSHPTKHTFKCLNPTLHYSVYPHGRSTTFKNTYTAVLSVGPLEDSRMVMFRTKKPQQSPVTRVCDTQEGLLLHHAHTHGDLDSDLETHPLESRNYPRKAPKTTHELFTGHGTLSVVTKEDDGVSFGQGKRPSEKFRSASSKVSSDTLPIIVPLDKGASTRSASGVSSGTDKGLATKNPQLSKGALTGPQKKVIAPTAVSLGAALKYLDPPQQVLVPMHAADLIQSPPTPQPT